MHYQPTRTIGLAVGGALAAWALLVTLLFVAVARDRGTDLFAAIAWIGAGIALTAGALLAYWTIALATLRYTVDRNGLVIAWAGIRQIVPLDAIEKLVPGTSVGVPAVRGISWPGYHVGSAEIRRIGRVLFYSTHQAPDQVLYVMTAERNYAISVPDPAAFAREIQVRQDLGPTAAVTHHVERALPAVQGFWRDRAALLLLVAVGVLGAAAWIAVGVAYNGLPQTLAAPFPAGAPGLFAEAAPREQLREAPRAAALVLLADLVLGIAFYAWDRFAAYTVLAAGVAAQGAILVALAIAIARA